MAIQNRRGAYSDFDPQKLVPGEWAVVQSGDPNSTRGKSVYMAFDVGDVERMATYEDMLENIESATSDIQTQFTSELTQTIADANDAVDDMQDDVGTFINTATSTVNQLTGQVNTAVSEANTATSNANTATARANDAVDSIQHIIDENNAVLSWNGRTGEVVPESGDYTSAQITHGNSTVANALTFDSTPTAGSQRAVQSGGVYSIIGNAEMGTTATTITGAIAELVAQRHNNLAAGYGASKELSTTFAIIPMTNEYVLGSSFTKVSDGGYRAQRDGLLLVSAYAYVSGVNAGDVVAISIGRYNSGWVWESPTTLVAGTTDRSGVIANLPVSVNASDIIYLRARNVTATRGSVSAPRLVIEYI